MIPHGPGDGILEEGETSGSSASVETIPRERTCSSLSLSLLLHMYGHSISPSRCLSLTLLCT